MPLPLAEPRDKPILIYLIGATLFITLTKKPGVEVFIATIYDIKKALKPKI